MAFKDDQVKMWLSDIKRYIVPLLFLLFPVALSGGDWAQIRVLLIFLSVLAGASWFFFLMLSEKAGKGLLPDFSLKPLLESAVENPIGAALVVVGFFAMFCTFLLVVAFLVAPR